MTQTILGIDEVGRGPWAGPLVFGAVVLGENFQQLSAYNELRDSKKLSIKKRSMLATVIRENADGYGLGWVSAAEIDHYGLGLSLKIAARRAVKELLRQKVIFDSIIVDGTINFLAGTPLEERVTIMPKADQLVKEVSAASIIAKVARDQYMLGLKDRYPEYGFENHVGYGTAKHRAALAAYGICAEHRQSIRPIAQLIQSNCPLTDAEQREIPNSASSKRTQTGRANHYSGHRAEQVVADLLKSQGHNLITVNYRTESYEIDIISTKGSKIYFTEVKYHRDSTAYTPLEQINTAKLEKMHYAAQKFLQARPKLQDLQPILAAASVVGEDFTVKDWLELD